MNIAGLEENWKNNSFLFICPCGLLMVSQWVNTVTLVVSRNFKKDLLV